MQANNIMATVTFTTFDKTFHVTLPDTRPSERFLNVGATNVLVWFDQFNVEHASNFAITAILVIDISYERMKILVKLQNITGRCNIFIYKIIRAKTLMWENYKWVDDQI